MLLRKLFLHPTRKLKTSPNVHQLCQCYNVYCQLIQWICSLETPENQICGKQSHRLLMPVLGEEDNSGILVSGCSCLNHNTAHSLALKMFLNFTYSNLSTFLVNMRTTNKKLNLAETTFKLLLLFYGIQNGLTSMKIKTESSNDLAPPLTLLKKQSVSNKTDSVCIHCKKPGHPPANCWVKYTEKSPKTAAAHLTVQDNYNQLSTQLNLTERGYFFYFQPLMEFVTTLTK
ncbi:hypothetical protein VP01_5624g1 [Puccinia sorghi]|uniref:Uncharacterized protein n=1 Tax=Puccinia sorghi TaxID=27349 RepID=A0A0L6UJQ2_9BASI|nr:hypothetical protein VP01_5624g1 [Puccinia sorghi]